MNSIQQIEEMYQKMFQEANIERREIVARQKEAKQKELETRALQILVGRMENIRIAITRGEKTAHLFTCTEEEAELADVFIKKTDKMMGNISFYKTTDGDGYHVPICIKVFAKWELL